MDNEKVICPYDKIEINPQPFGFGYVWICPVCGNVLKSITKKISRSAALGWIALVMQVFNKKERKKQWTGKQLKYGYVEKNKAG